MALSSVLSSSLSSSSSTCRFCDGKDDVLLSTKVVFSLFSSFFSPLAVSAAAAEEEEEGRGGGGQEDETDALVKLTPPLLMSSIVNEEGLALECWQLFSLFLLSLFFFFVFFLGYKKLETKNKIKRSWWGGGVWGDTLMWVEIEIVGGETELIEYLPM